MILLIISLCLIFLAFQFVFEKRRQYIAFQAAKARAQITGRPLVVFGDPKYSILSSMLFGQERPCGDACIDKHGCLACQDLSVARNIPEILPTMETDSCVAFVSSVLSYIDDEHIEEVIYNLQRICGPDNLFVVEPTLYGIWAWNIKFRRVFSSYPPEDTEFKWTTVKEKRKDVGNVTLKIEGMPNNYGIT